MSEKKYNIYFDFGSSKIRGVAFNKNNKDINFLVEQKCSSLFRLNQIDLTESEKIIEKIVFGLEKNTSEYIDSINVMIDSPDSFSINLSLSKKKDSKKITTEDIQYLIQDAKQQILKSYSDQQIIHIIVSNYKADNIDYDSPPIEIECKLFSLDIMFICFPKNLIKKLENLFYKFQISLNKILCSSYTKSLNYKEQFNDFEKIAFVDIGFEKTSIIIYDKFKLKAFTLLPVGGNHVTKDIAKVLKLGHDEAENIKINLDNNIVLTDKNQESKIFKDDFLNKSKYKKETLELSQKVIFSRIDEILNLSLNTIRFYESSLDINKLKIILTGQGSQILNNNSIYINEVTPLFEEIIFFPENSRTICESGLMLSNGISKQEVVIIPKKIQRKGIFERLFHFFE